MSIESRKQTGVFAVVCSLLISALILTACGGGSGGGDSDTTAGIGGTGIVAGKVTDFGSIYVNGGRYDIDSSNFVVDGTAFTGQAGQNELALGMIVQISAETESGEYTGAALNVVYDDEIEGPVSSATPFDSLNPKRTITVFDQVITIDETDTIFNGTSFAAIDVGEVVEISGFRTLAGDIVATYVEGKGALPATTAVELKGTITGLSAPTFMLGLVKVTFDPSDIPAGVTLMDGLYVEVGGTYLSAVSVDADEIEIEDENFDDDVDDISLQGIVSGFTGPANDFFIDTQRVNVNSAQPLSAVSAIANGLNIEVEGNIVAGTLIAEEVEIREGETKLKSFVSFVHADNIHFEINYTGLPGSILVNTDNQTLFDDESPSQLNDFSVADLNVGDYVIVEGTEVPGNVVVAETVKRKDAGDPDDSKLEGEVDAIDSGVSITVLGITFSVNGSTDYEDATGNVPSAVFFAQLSVGDQVEIEDKEVADGIADEVELE